MTARVLLHPRRAQPFHGRHPWVYAGAIAAVVGAPEDGDEVDLYSHTGHFIARGLYNSASKIRVRLYCWEQDQPLDATFFQELLARAIRLRSALGCNGEAQACRLVFSDGDGLSGLVVDRYDRWLVVQFTSLGLARRQELFLNLLIEMLNPLGIYLRTERGIGQLEGLPLEDHLLWGQLPEEPLVIEENGLEFVVDLATGQKTGFYLDQRDNRARVAQFAAGRRVLDAFCYSGGFAVHASAHGASEVIAIDQSGPALDLARSNAERNGLTNIQRVQADVFQYLKKLAEEGQRFGLLVLDPPKFARSRKAIAEALRGYRRLFSLGVDLLEPEGILVTCCCSGLITADMLEELLAQVSARSTRAIQLLERRGPSPDHPVSVNCLESHYLKCLLARVW
jgi:23S rRNA (cytosine1962-C5)-methyltransferase